MQLFKILFLLLLFTPSCQKETKFQTIIPDDIVPNSLRINEIQILGSHNSYRTKIDVDILAALTEIESILPSELNLKELDYSHLSLKEQLEKYGIRQIELDLYQDQNGGLFYNRKGYELVEKSVSSNENKLKEPGIKIMHIPDIDFNTHYLTFIESLQAVSNFSTSFPNHLPITIMLEMKSETIADHIPGAGFVDATPWTENSYKEMEEEILAVFSKSKIIKPDNIRQNENTLRAGLMLNGWPTVEDARGKAMFIFTNSESQNNVYKTGAPSLENKLCFTNANPNDDDAAFLMYNDPIGSFDEIQEKVSEGFLVRTRSDAGTFEARNGDYTKWNKALLSGAQFISTDYYVPDHRFLFSTEWTDYAVGFDNGIYQLNPIF